MTECLFCKLKSVKEGIIFEDKYFYSILDVNPVSPGYALVIAKRHVADFLDLNPEEWIAMKMALEGTMKSIDTTDLKKAYQKMIDKGYGERSKKLCQSMLEDKNMGKHPDAYNIGVNDGAAAGRTIHHLHIHIIPRYGSDSQEPEGGIRKVLSHKDII